MNTQNKKQTSRRRPKQKTRQTLRQNSKPKLKQKSVQKIQQKPKQKNLKLAQKSGQRSKQTRSSKQKTKQTPQKKISHSSKQKHRQKISQKSTQRPVKRAQQGTINFAFIDAQNLHMAINDLGWKIDYMRFRVYLREHYNVEKAYMFMGFKPDEQQLYNFLQDAGFILVFKPILELKNGTVKGNCDAELVLQVMIDYKRYNKAIVVSGDGDFHCIVKYLQEQKKLETVLVPTERNCSILIKKIAKGDLTLVSDLKKKIQYTKRKKPLQDGA
jgi:uncharacterized LabA/DUF88 family protein